MSGRSLAFLTGIAVERLKGVGAKRARDLAKGGVATVADLLLHFPRRYIDRSLIVPIAEVVAGGADEVTVIGRVERIGSRRIRGGRVMVEASIADGTGRFRVVWWNQPFRERQFPAGSEVAVAGKFERFRGSLQVSQPDIYLLDDPGESLLTGRVVPIHPSVGGVGPRWLRTPIRNALTRSRPITEALPADLVARLRLVSRDRALADIHFPETLGAMEQARARLIFDELFRIEVALALRKHRQIEESVGIAHDVPGDLAGRFIGALPYRLTGAQQRSIREIGADLARPHPMHRLLQGEVGSGKTVVAMASLLTAVEGGFQGAVMAPTEVLADQHYLGLTGLVREAGMAPAGTDAGGTGSLFDAPPSELDGSEPGRPEPVGRPIRMGLLTSNSAAANFRPDVTRDELLGMVRAGDIDILVGTHALIQEGVEFADLGLAVIDEQHRFGVHQRVELREKGRDAQPDLLIMTATPIPRTLSMTIYGDLDVSLLDEMPPGRLPVETRHSSKDPAALEKVYDVVRREAAAGRQTFVVCPLVEDSDKVYAKSATTEYRRLQKVFPELRVGLIHGQLRPTEKEQAMAELRAGDIDVLVATTVIEVGIDVPAATVMVIEDADRFGLSQLHQLRGRVGRGGHASYCFLVGEPATPDGAARLEAMVATTDGFELAERDLVIRGQGTVFGAKQAGLGDLRLADVLRDYEVLLIAREEAFALVGRDPQLEAHRELAEEIKALLGEDVEWLFRS